MEDWRENPEIRETLVELQKLNPQGLIHRKDWEWAIGIIAMERFDKLNKDSVAVGIGAGREEVLFYLANKIFRVYATDLYDGKDWKNFVRQIFLRYHENIPRFHTDEDALTVMR